MLAVSEIFLSIQGESTSAGLPFAFVRLAGCNLRCAYCDTAYARDAEGAEALSVADAAGRAAAFGVPRVEITGGEPLLQAETPALAARLLADGFAVWVETNGSLDIGALPAGARRIVDVKCPGSGAHAAMDWGNLARLRPGDEVKFVVSDEADYRWALDVAERHALAGRTEVLLSPVAGRMDAAALAGLMLRDRARARLQVQLHKVLWPGADRGR
jgi:7-carboxy-7-deazaguanine synthase